MTNIYNIHRFPNGVRLVHRRTKSPVAHFGIMVNAGSRDEMEGEQGLAHLIEHMIFKGTPKRTAYQVISRLENVGADMNAFTTKEETCVYASFLTRHYGKAVELISDIVFNSTFPEKELIKEKAVVIDEINSYKDNPAEWIHDEFDEVLFPGHPLGRNILGKPARLKQFTPADLQAFMRRTYLSNQVVVSSIGNLTFEQVIAKVGKYLEALPVVSEEKLRVRPKGYLPQTIARKFGRHQAHIILGNTGFHYHHPLRVPMALLNNILGGPAMNSRLNLALREKHGIAYNLESNFQPLSDTGLFTIYIGTDEKMVDKALELVRMELDKLRNTTLSKNQLRIAREQLKGQLAISVESQQQEMISAAKSILVYDKVDSTEEINAKIDKVSAEEIQQAAEIIFNPESMSLLVYNRI
ncbi:MAG: insulinase family protein [Bacteroidales bacterium]|nr:insulinase family protein [Bacteroidales bacterium]